MKLSFINAAGQTMSLSHNDYFFLTHVDGQSSIATDISSVVVGGIDGDDVNNIQAQPRPVVLDLRIKSGINVEDAKRYILNYVKIKQNATLEWEQNNRIVRLSGRVENIDMPRWTNAVTAQISMHCSQPFWEDIESVIERINEVVSMHYFTNYPNDMLYFTEEGIVLGEIDLSRTRHFVNNGDVAVGMEIEILALGTVTNPIIYNEAGDFFGVGHGEGANRVVLSEGDIIRISTIKSKKYAKLNGNSVLGKIKPRSTWLQVEAGLNTFTINSEESTTDNMTYSLIFTQRYI